MNAASYRSSFRRDANRCRSASFRMPFSACAHHEIIAGTALWAVPVFLITMIFRVTSSLSIRVNSINIVNSLYLLAVSVIVLNFFLIFLKKQTENQQ